MGLNPIRLVSLKKEDILRQTYVERKPCEHEGGDQGDFSKSQGTPEMASKPPEARGEAGTDSPHSPRRKLPRRHGGISQSQRSGLSGERDDGPRGLCEEGKGSSAHAPR